MNSGTYLVDPETDATDTPPIRINRAHAAIAARRALVVPLYAAIAGFGIWLDPLQLEEQATTDMVDVVFLYLLLSLFVVPIWILLAMASGSFWAWITEPEEGNQ